MMQTMFQTRSPGRLSLWIMASTFAFALIAGAFFFRWHKGTPEFPPNLIPEGVSASLQTNLMQAKKRVERNPGAGTWGALGELCMAHELLPQAKWCFLKAAELKPDEPKWWYLQGLIAEEVDVAEAIAAYQKAAELDSASPALHLRLGKLQARAGQFSEAENSLNRAAELSDKHPIVLRSIAQLFAMQGQNDKATEAYRKLFADNRSGQDLLLEADQWFTRHSVSDDESGLTEKLQQRPQFTESLPEPWFNGVLAQMPKAASMAAQAGALASSQQYDAAIRLYDQLVRSESRNSRSHAFRAMVMMNAGETDKAKAEIQRVCESFPGDALAWTCKGAIEAKTEDYESATESLQKAVALKPDYIEAHRALLMIYQRREMTAEMEEQYRILLTLTSGDPLLKAEYERFKAQRSSGNE